MAAMHYAFVAVVLEPCAVLLVLSRALRATRLGLMPSRSFKLDPRKMCGTACAFNKKWDDPQRGYDV